MSEVQPFGPETPERTEGITFDADGNLYVGTRYNQANDELLDVSLAGTFESVAEEESILGLESPGPRMRRLKGRRSIGVDQRSHKNSLLPRDRRF